MKWGYGIEMECQERSNYFPPSFDPVTTTTSHRHHQKNKKSWNIEDKESWNIDALSNQKTFSELLTQNFDQSVFIWTEVGALEAKTKLLNQIVQDAEMMLSLLQA